MLNSGYYAQMIEDVDINIKGRLNFGNCDKKSMVFPFSRSLTKTMPFVNHDL